MQRNIKAIVEMLQVLVENVHEAAEINLEKIQKAHGMNVWEIHFHYKLALDKGLIIETKQVSTDVRECQITWEGYDYFEANKPKKLGTVTQGPGTPFF